MLWVQRRKKRSIIFLSFFHSSSSHVGEKNGLLANFLLIFTASLFSLEANRRGPGKLGILQARSLAQHVRIGAELGPLSLSLMVAAPKVTSRACFEEQEERGKESLSLAE